MSAKLIQADLYRYSGGKKSIAAMLISSANFRFTYFFRQVSTHGKMSPKGIIGRLFYRRLTFKLGFQIPKTVKIGPGLLIVHFGSLIVNSKVIIGSNCTLYPGITIGAGFKGDKMGTPVIGNKVWIGTNAVIVGKITIGDNVLIAPNSFVNISVPSNSIVFGNPAIIKSREDATDGYIINAV